MNAPFGRYGLFVLGLFTASSLCAAAPDVQVFLGGSPASTGNYPFPFPAGDPGLVLDNGLVRFTFNRDDSAGGVVTGWTNTSITATSVIANGTELAHNLNGVEPRDPDRQHSFYIDAGGGSTRLVCTEVRVLRASTELVEVAFIDNTSTPLRHEHHLIMRRGKPGLYGYDILTAAAATSISEVRMNARWDRGLLDHAFNWERGEGQQPTYAYLATQTPMGDETWRIDGVNNPSLPWPDSNSGNLPANTVYTKYNWSLYHHENPMFGHYGHGFGVWLTPLGGVTDRTLCAFYGVGPNHQDLAIHQDALILNYFGANHYGLPSYSLASGYKRLYGPWFTYVTTGDPTTSAGVIESAAAIADTEIAENRNGSDWMNDPLYPTPAQRSVVTGQVQIADGRPAANLWVLLSTQNVTDVYTIHEPTYFVRTDANGNFSLPGIPPPTAPGTTTPSSYVLYIFSAAGSVTDQFKQTGITLTGAATNLGTITWTPVNHQTFLWQIGKADRMGGEFALATNPGNFSNPRAYEKPSQIPANLTWTVGSSWEPENWYYAQTNAGAWTIAFNLDRTYTGTAFLTVSTSMQQGGAPTVTVNGAGGLTGTIPNNNDSTIARQADRSGFPRRAVITFPASRLVVGTNTIRLNKTSGGGAGTGPGWDTLLLEADETTPPAPAALTASIRRITGTASAPIWTFHLDNSGGAANDARLENLTLTQSDGVTPATPQLLGRDPSRFAVPLGNVPAGGSIDYDLALNFASVPFDAKYTLALAVSANGGRARTIVTGSDLQVTPVTITRGGFVANRRTGRVVQQVNLRNVTSVPVTGPLYLVLDGLSSNTTLVNGSGLTANNAPAGSPYLNVTDLNLAPGASVNVSLEFTNPTSGGITYTARILSGIPTP
jgi:rhamnogalacturonan endolyase